MWEIGQGRGIRLSVLKSGFLHDAQVKGWLKAESECDKFEDFGADKNK